MLRTRKPVAAVLISAFAGASLAGFAAVSTQKVQAADRPAVVKMATKKEEIREALEHLERAQSLLAKADHDESGYDYKAYKATHEAVRNARIALGLDADTGKEK